MAIDSQKGMCVTTKMIGCLSKFGSECYNCARGYDLHQGKCYKSFKGCRTYSANGECLQCFPGLSMGKYKCMSKKDCSYPFQLGRNGECVIQDCEEFYDFGCVSCKPGFAVAEDGACVLQTSPGCLVYDKQGQCTSCYKPFYELKKHSCVPVGCFRTDKDGHCLECNNHMGFILKEGTCSIPDCLYYNEQGCQLCASGLKPYLKGCRDSGDLEIMCTSCRHDQFMGSDHKCYDRDPNCEDYLQGKCIKCVNGYTASATGRCIRRLSGCIYEDGVCVRCKDNFKYTRNDQSCSMDGCKKYQGDACAKCHHNFLLNEQGLCHIPHCVRKTFNECVQCEEKWRVYDGRCAPFDPNCLLYHLEECQQCTQGSTMQDGYCQPSQPGCLYKEGVCYDCEKPWRHRAVDNVCYIDGCLEHSALGCSLCQDGYEVFAYTCRLPHCEHSEQGRCFKCHQDYYLTGEGHCELKLDSCALYSQGQCVECATNFYLKDGLCWQGLPGCVYNQGLCEKCHKPFVMQDGNCTIVGCN